MNIFYNNRSKSLILYKHRHLLDKEQKCACHFKFKHALKI